MSSTRTGGGTSGGSRPPVETGDTHAAAASPAKPGETGGDGGDEGDKPKDDAGKGGAVAGAGAGGDPTGAEALARQEARDARIAAESERDQLKGALQGAHGELETAQATIEAKDKEIGQLRTEIATLSKRPAVEKGAKRAKAKSFDLEMARPERTALTRLFKGATAPFHLIFVDDQGKEVTALEPVMVTGTDAWAETPNGMMLRQPVQLHASHEMWVGGVVLVDADDEQVSASPLLQPVRLGPGATLRLDRQIVF